MGLESIVEKLIAPKIEEFVKLCKGKYNEYMIPTAEHFQEYFDRTYEKYSTINTLVFHNSQRLLKDIYIPESLVNEFTWEREFKIIKINRFPVKLINKYKKILITDTAGMGKSTIMKRMFIDLIDNGMEEVGIPIYIELNRLKKDRTILKEIHEELSALSKEFDKNLFLKLIQTGGFIFFMDGYDEISIADRIEVTNDIQSFISKAGTKNYYIMTSRPEDNLTSFGDFQEFRIQPLIKSEAFELLRKYDLSKNKELSKKLIQLLKSGKFNSINEYLENPLLVSLLYSAFDHKQKIPLKKHLFYRQVYDAYFDAHDLTKGINAHQKRSGLDIDDFNRVLRFVGYECLIRIGVQFDKVTILNSIDRAQVFYGTLDFNRNDFLKDLLTTVPLFRKDGTGYKWVHKSLMEYFAARFIAEDAKQNQDNILTAIKESKHINKYINMLDLYYDIDIKGFSKNITLPLCENYVKFHDNNFINIGVNKEFIDERIAIIYLGRYAFVITRDNYLDNKDLYGLTDMGFSVDNIECEQYDKQSYIHFARVLFKESLLMLLYKKTPLIFSRMRYLDKYKAFKSLNVYGDGSIEHYNAYLVDVKTGQESEGMYDAINQLIFRYKQVYLNYEACKKEVERIKMEIAHSKDATDLLAGI